MNTLVLAGWGVIAAGVLALLVARRVIARHDDETLHLEHGTATEQVTVERQLTAVDRWGKLLTIVLVVYSIILAGLFTYKTLMTKSGF